MNWLYCKTFSEERSAGNPHATFCGDWDCVNSPFYPIVLSALGLTFTFSNKSTIDRLEKSYRLHFHDIDNGLYPFSLTRIGLDFDRNGGSSIEESKAC